jgi:hypothetical protein
MGVDRSSWRSPVVAEANRPGQKDAGFCRHRRIGWRMATIFVGSRWPVVYVLRMGDGTVSGDWRYEELRRWGERERRMTEELIGVRHTIAQLIKELAPPHASTKRIHEVVDASGYSRTLVEAVRGGENMWSRLPR